MMRAIIDALAAGPLVRVEAAHRSNGFTSRWRSTAGGAEFDGLSVLRAVDSGFAHYDQRDIYRPRVEITDAGVAAFLERAA